MSSSESYWLWDNESGLLQWPLDHLGSYLILLFRHLSFTTFCFLSLCFLQNLKDYFECSLSKSYSSSSYTLGIDLWRGRRCCSGNLQLPPLSQRQSERARTPEGDGISRPTTLPLTTLPSIAITTVSQEWWVASDTDTNAKSDLVITSNTIVLSKPQSMSVD